MGRRTLVLKQIIKSTIKLLKTSERFIGPLFCLFIEQRILSEQLLLKIICIYMYAALECKRTMTCFSVWSSIV